VKTRSTIIQVAKKIGVSPSTVSRAFTHPGKLKPETVQLVMDAAAEIGYVPNHHARALITGRSGAIGLVLPDVSNPFFPPLIRYAQLAAEEHGLAVFVADTAEDTKREMQMIERLSPQVEGLIIASSRLSDRSLQTIAERQPTVLINRDVPGVPRVLISTSQALTEGLRHLVESGHTRIAYIGGPARSWSDAQRRGCVRSVLEGYGLEGHFFQAKSGNYADALELSGEVELTGVTAVIAFDDVVAHGLMSGFRAHGLHVPEDISVLGCDDTLAITTHPPLSSISLDLASAAHTAVTILRSASRPGASSDQRFELEGSLVLRGTTT
jgi:LacI family transcriptional regulator